MYKCVPLQVVPESIDLMHNLVPSTEEFMGSLTPRSPAWDCLLDSLVGKSQLYWTQTWVNERLQCWFMTNTSYNNTGRSFSAFSKGCQPHKYQATLVGDSQQTTWNVELFVLLFDKLNKWLGFKNNDFLRNISHLQFNRKKVRTVRYKLTNRTFSWFSLVVLNHFY